MNDLWHAYTYLAMLRGSGVCHGAYLEEGFEGEEVQVDADAVSKQVCCV